MWIRVFFTLIIIGFVFGFSSEIKAEQKKPETTAASLFVQAMTIFRKHRYNKDDDPEAALETLKKVQDKLNRMIEEFPDDPMTLKLVMGELRGNWLERIEHLLKRTQEELDKRGNVEFTKEEKACLDELTSACIQKLLIKTVARVEPQKGSHFIKQSNILLESIKSALDGERKPLLDLIRKDSRAGRAILIALAKNGYLETGVNLVLEMGTYRDRKITSYTKALRVLHHATRGVLYRKYNADQPRLNYSHQSRHCYHFRRKEDSVKPDLKATDWNKLYQVDQGFKKGLCAEKDIEKLAQDYFDLLVSPVDKMTKKDIDDGYFLNIRGLINRLIIFGHNKQALKLLHQVPEREILQIVPRKKNHRIFNKKNYGQYLGGLSVEVMVEKLAKRSRQR